MGKTSLTERFVYGRFEEKYLTTVGVKISQKMVLPIQAPGGGRTVQHAFLIWDIAGLEKFDHVADNYFRGAAGALAVADLTRPETIEELKRFATRFRSVNPEAKLVLIRDRLHPNQRQVRRARRGGLLGAVAQNRRVFMTDRFARLLEHKGFGAVLFDSRFNIVRMSPAAEAILGISGTSKPRGSFLDLFPEFVGVEAQVAAIVAGKDADYRLDHVNRESGPGRVRYLNLLLLPDPAPDRALLVIEDVTGQALSRQAANQKRYELFLYRTNADFRRKHSSDRILGDSPAIRRVRDTIQKLGRTPSATVLLTGETGCGKNLAARVIHGSSMPPDAPFIEINCAALPEHLIESELFGYEKGAFTHAVSAKPGLLEEAHGGTLFLDEIGEMSANMQAKLLAVLESRCFRRLGSTRSIKVNIRVIASTNRDLQADVAGKRFREDLFFRLNVVTLPLPPLRELGDDILAIAEHLLNVYNVEFKKRVKGFSADARRGLLDHPWPGNVRELGNCIERAMIFAENDQIDASDLVLSPFAAPVVAADGDRWTVPSAGIDLEEVERRLIVSALNQSGQNKTKAARLLGLSRDTLRYRLDKYRDQPPRLPRR